ncbi:hypothetical protein TYRP_023356, partial [Tyrophagus putrescentiae]
SRAKCPLDAGVSSFQITHKTVLTSAADLANVHTGHIEAIFQLTSFGILRRTVLRAGRSAGAEHLVLATLFGISRRGCQGKNRGKRQEKSCRKDELLVAVVVVVVITHALTGVIWLIGIVRRLETQRASSLCPKPSVPINQMTPAFNIWGLLGWLVKLSFEILNDTLLVLRLNSFKRF